MDKLPRYIQVSSTLEFSRLVCALERAPRISFLHEHEGKKILSVQMDILKEKPISSPGHSLGHQVPKSISGEDAENDSHSSAYNTYCGGFD